MIGGIVENFGSSCHDGTGGFFITEGDEYDTAFFDKRSKFFHYLPDQLILNNLEFDHADIFDSLEDIKKIFQTDAASNSAKRSDCRQWRRR